MLCLVLKLIWNKLYRCIGFSFLSIKVSQTILNTKYFLHQLRNDASPLNFQMLGSIRTLNKHLRKNRFQRFIFSFSCIFIFQIYISALLPFLTKQSRVLVALYNLFDLSVELNLHRFQSNPFHETDFPGKPTFFCKCVRLNFKFKEQKPSFFNAKCH